MRRYVKRFREFLTSTKWKLFFWLYMKSVWLFVKLDTIRFQNVEFKSIFDKENIELAKRVSSAVCERSGMCASKTMDIYGVNKAPREMPVDASPMDPNAVEIPFSSVTDKYIRSFEESCKIRELTPEEHAASLKAIAEINKLDVDYLPRSTDAEV